MKKKVISMLLILILALTSLWGCSKDSGKETGQLSSKDQTDNKKKENKEITMGRYMEHEITLPEIGADAGIIKILENKEKQIEAYSYSDGSYLCYRLQKDLSWESSVPGWLNNEFIINDDMIIKDICVGCDNNYYAIITDYSNKTAKNRVVKSVDGETLQEVNIPYLEKEMTERDYTYYPSVDKIQVMEDGSIVLHDMWEEDKLFVFSPDGKEIDKLRIGINEIGGTQNFITSGKYIIAIQEDGRGVMVYDPLQSKAERVVEANDIRDYVTFALKSDGTLFLGNGSGIHRLQKDGTLWETTVDGALNSMSMPTMSFEALFVTEGEQEEYYGVFGNSTGGYQLMHYVYDKNVASVPSKEISVYSLKENKTIRQAISLFQAQNTDIKVNYVVAMDDETGNTADYIRALNTELLAGNGADILVLDGLPVESYIEKGILSDISEAIGSIEADGNLLTNIKECYKTGGKIYSIPLRFTVPVIVGDNKAVGAGDNLPSIINYISSNNNKPYLSDVTYKQLLENYLALYKKDLFENNELKDEKFIEFLKAVKMIADNSTIVEKEVETQSTVKGLFDESGLFQGNIMSLPKKAQVSMIEVKNIFDTMFLFKIAEDTDMKYQAINKSFLPNGMIGLSSQAKEADIAKEFIRFLFESKVQDINVNDGFPVNVKSLEKWITEENQNIMVMASDDDGNMISAAWPSKEDRDSLYKIILDLNQPIIVDKMLNNTIIEVALQYLEGDMDESQTLSLVKSKINTYLAE